MELFESKIVERLASVFSSYRARVKDARRAASLERSSLEEELGKATEQLSEMRRELAGLSAGSRVECDPELGFELARIDAAFGQACKEGRAKADQSVQEARSSVLARLDDIERQRDDLASVSLLYQVEQLAPRPSGVTPEKHDISALVELARMANESGRIAETKRMLEIGGYYRQSQMAADVLRMREEMSLYLDQQKRRAARELKDLAATADKIAQDAMESAKAQRDKAASEARRQSSERVDAGRRVREWQLESAIRESEELVGALGEKAAAERASLDSSLSFELAHAESEAREEIGRLDLAGGRAWRDDAWEQFGASGDAFQRPWAFVEAADHRIALARRHTDIDVPDELADALEPLGGLVDAATGKAEGLCLMDVSRPEPLVIRYKHGQRDLAVAAARRMALSCTRALRPSALEVLVCDPVGTGTSLGSLGELFAGGHPDRFSLAANEAQTNRLLWKVTEGMGATGAAIAGSTPPTVARYNETHPDHELPHRVLMLLDIDRGEYGTRELEKIAQVVSRARDFGITVIMVRQDKPPERAAAREKLLSRIERQSSVATLLPSGPRGACTIRQADGTTVEGCELFCDDGASQEFLSTLAAACRS